MLNYEKYHGTGNDFIIFNGIENEYDDKISLAQKVCHRNFGIGADGMIIVEKSTLAHVKMDFYNADGTVAPMCGNGIRCFAKYVYDNNIVKKTEFKVETLAGIMKVSLHIFEKKVSSVTINMGMPHFDIQNMDVNLDHAEYINKPIAIAETSFNISIITIGTLHGVIIVDDLKDIDIDYYGKIIESHKLFPKKINVNFTQILDNNNIKVITYERGVGKTLSCGTGSAAAAVVSSMLGHTGNHSNVHVPGGKLTIKQKENQVYMSGPATLISTGSYIF